MGNRASVLPEQDVRVYEQLTYLSKAEIIRAYKKMRSRLAKDNRIVVDPEDMAMSFLQMIQMPELENNPFAERICEVFSSRKNGIMTFEDYLDMLSVFSENAPKSVKIAYAFKIYDFDNDEKLGWDDLMELVTRITTSEAGALDQRSKEQIVEQILKEADLGSDGYVSLTEFELIVSRSPDFAKTFCMRN